MGGASATGKILGVLAAFFVSTALFAGEPAAEILEPDGSEKPAKEDPLPRPTPPVTPKEEDPPPPALNVDEPDFKATVKYPTLPAPKIDIKGEKSKPANSRSWALPEEEGLDPATVETEPEEPATPEDTANQEEVSPALAKVLARDKGNKKPKDVVQMFAAVVEEEPENAPARYHLGIAHVKNGEPLKGVAELEKAMLLKPGNIKYQCAYGQAALQVGWIEKAASACRAAAVAAPNEARYQSALGDCYLAAGSVADAADCYARAISLDKGKNPDYVYNLGLTYLHSREFKRSIKVFDEVISMRKDYAPYYCSRGVAYENTKNVKMAMQDYNMALKLDKNNAYAHFLLAGIYSDPNDPTYTNKFEAVAHAEKAVKLSNYRNAQYMMGLARALRVAFNYEQAVAIARKAIELDPRDEYKQELAKYEAQLKQEGAFLK